MLEVLWQARFTLGAASEVIRHRFYGSNLDMISEQIQSFVAIKKSKGWDLLENEIISIKKIEKE